MSRIHRRIGVAAVLLAPIALALPSSANAATNATAPATSAANAKPAASTTAKVNINTATSAQLQTVKGVGPKMAKEIMEYRPYSNFTKLEQKLTKYFPLSAVKAVEPSFTLK
jgi:competence protein ComEA